MWVWEVARRVWLSLHTLHLSDRSLRSSHRSPFENDVISNSRMDSAALVPWNLNATDSPVVSNSLWFLLWPRCVVSKLALKVVDGASARWILMALIAERNTEVRCFMCGLLLAWLNGWAYFFRFNEFSHAASRRSPTLTLAWWCLNMSLNLNGV
jgi:hypothetical protein